MWGQTLPEDLAQQLRDATGARRMPLILAAVEAGWTPTAIARAIGADGSTLRRQVRTAVAKGVKPAKARVAGPDENVVPLSQFATRIVADQATVYRWAQDGIIPGLQPGRDRSLDRRQAEAWIDAHPELDQAHASEWMDSTEAAAALGLTWHGLYWRIQHGQVEAVQVPSGRWRFHREVSVG